MVNALISATIPPVPRYGVNLEEALDSVRRYGLYGRSMTRSTLTELTDATFDELTAGTDLPVLVEFSARWCGPCRMLAPILHDLAGEQEGRLLVAQIDVDDNPTTTRRYDVMAMPTLLLFVGGRERKRLVGARGKAHLLQELAEHLSPPISGI
jgi:thioredoxin 1